jgi:hypothetical protein
MSVANCLLAAGVVPMTGTPPVALGTSATVFLDNCDDTTGNTNYRFAWYMSGGIVAQDILVVRTGGATDGVTPQSWKVTTNTTGPPTLFMPQELPPIARRYNTTGSVTATIYFVTDTAAVLDNSQIWMDVEGLTNSGSPLSTLSSDRIADLIPGTSVSGHSSDTSAWDTGAAARQDNHAYSVGDVFKTATAPGQIFRVTTAGTSATSEPAAYTGVTDGTQITTDRNGGGMVVRCMVRQKLTKTFTLQKKGVVFAAPRLATATLVAYIDPNLNLA